MYHGTHSRSNTGFTRPETGSSYNNPEDPRPKGRFSSKGPYFMCRKAPEEPEDPETPVNELHEVSPGVWECEILVPTGPKDPPELTSIYRGELGGPNLDYKNYYGGPGGSADDATEGESTDCEGPNMARGNFVPVYGPNSLNFPPDYRLVNSRLGPQYRCYLPRPLPNPFPHYINNQFLKPTKLARWNSMENDDPDKWDPFNLKTGPNGAGNPNLANAALPPNLRMRTGPMELLLYPQPGFRRNVKV